MSLQPEEFLTSGHIVVETTPSSQEVCLDLAAEVLARFGEVRFVAQGGSMIPGIYPGDLLTFRACALADAHCGDIVLCLHERRFWIHRLTRKWSNEKRLAFATQGDALAHEDPPTDENQLLGRVTTIVRHGKPVRLARTATFWSALLCWSVRNSSFVATSLLRLHSLRARIFCSSAHAFANTSCRSPESIR